MNILEDMKMPDMHAFMIDAMLRAAQRPDSVMRQSIAFRAVDRYHGLIETIGRQFSPEVWNANNALDRKVP